MADPKNKGKKLPPPKKEEKKGPGPSPAATPIPEEPKVEEPPMDEIMQAIHQKPPVDADGSKVLRDGLIIGHDEVDGMISRAMQRMFLWISSHKYATLQFNEKDSKELIFNSIKELDENLRQQWPRKGKLEVEVY